MTHRLTRVLFVAVLGASAVGSVSRAFADPEDRRERKEEHRREERREDRREDRERDRERREDRREGREREREREHAYRGPTMAPPAPRYERHVERPGHVWINGHYTHVNGQYIWNAGRFERERAGYRWREPRWEIRDGVYVRVEGEWYAPGPTIAPPAVRVERWEPRAGFLWVRGHHEWRGGVWAWVPGHYERERAGYIYREPTWVMRDGVYVQVGGSWEIVR
jgi:hypothetical protein